MFVLIYANVLEFRLLSSLLSVNMKYSELIDTNGDAYLDALFNRNPNESFYLKNATFAMFTHKNWRGELHEEASTNWKAHISVHPDDLACAWQIVYPILHQHTEQFKIINSQKLIKAMEIQQAYLEETIGNYEAFIRDYSKPLAALPALKQLAAQLSHSATDYRDIADEDKEGWFTYVKSKFSEQITKARQQVEEGARLAQGMQITIYMRPGTENKHRKVLQDIESCLAINHIRAGVIYPTDRQLGTYTSIRHPGMNYHDAVAASNYNPDNLRDPFNETDNLNKGDFMKRVVFLDVDNTLYYGQNAFGGQDVNETLIASLQEKGITDVYLFTNMGLSEIKLAGVADAPLDRYQLINLLKTRGLNVRAVITPADPYYQIDGVIQPLGAAYNTLYHSLRERLSTAEKPLDLREYTSNSEDLADYYMNELAWKQSKSMCDAQSRLAANQEGEVSTYSLQLRDNRSGAIHEDNLTRETLLEFFSRGSDKAHYSIEIVANPNLPPKRVVGKYLQVTSIKGPMMEFAIQQLRASLPASEALTIYYFDDDNEHLTACTAVVNDINQRQSGPQITLETYKMPGEGEFALALDNKAEYDEVLYRGTISLTFLFRVMTHPATKIVATILLIAGLVAATIGSCGLAGVAFAAIGASIAAAMIGTGAGSAILGMGVLASQSRFFGQKKTLEEEYRVPMAVAQMA